MSRISNISFFRFCWKNEKLDWPKCARTVPVPGPRSGTATYQGLRPNGTTFYQSEIPLLLPPKFPGFFPKWKAPKIGSVGSENQFKDLWSPVNSTINRVC